MFAFVARGSLFPPWGGSGAFGQLVLRVQAEPHPIRDLRITCEFAVDRLPAQAKEAPAARHPSLRLVRTRTDDAASPAQLA